MDSVKGRDISGCYTINGFAQALQVWVYTALLELGATFGYPLPNNPSPPILAYKGRKGRRQFKEAILSEKPWKWTMDCWEVTGTWVNTKPTVVSPAKKKVVKEDSPRPRKKARKEAPAEASEEAAAEASEEMTTTVGGLTKEDIKTMFKDIADAMREGFGTCLKEIKYLSERVEAVEKKVGITTKRKGTSSQNTTSPPKPTLEPESESVNGTNAGRKSLAEDKDLQKEDARYLEKRDAALALYRAKSDRTRKLAASQKSPYTANRTARVIISNRKLYPGYNPFASIDKTKLRELADWLKSCPHYRTALDKKPQWLEDCVWGMDIDDIYAPVNFADSHWIAMWISIPKRHIVVFDNICSSISPEELDVVMEPFLYMVPYLLVECASSDEQRAQYSLEPFTYERPTNIPPAKADFAKPNGKSMRDKMAVDIFQELPNVHEFENKDMDDILGTYDV
ncbi:unnamed protein product [Brassica oleracea]